MKKVILTLGLPASGKSTFINLLNLERGYKIFDSDTYHGNYEYRNEMMVKDIMEFTKDYASDSLLIASASGGNKWEETLKFFKDINYDVVVLYFKVDIEKAKELNSKRSRKVAEDIYTPFEKTLKKNVKLAKKYAKYFYEILPNIV